MKEYKVKTMGVCAKEISFALDGNTIHAVHFEGGCPGNTQAIAKLLEGTDASRAVSLLKGNDCRGRGTSCADQLARAVESALKESV